MLQIRLIHTPMEIRKIDSRDNPRLKHARRVRDGLEPEHMFVEGSRAVYEAVRSGVDISGCFIESGFHDDRLNAALVDDVAKKIQDVFMLSKKLFATIAATKASQGIVLICKRPAADREAFERARSDRLVTVPLVVMSTEINNPSNLGAVIRTAEAAGASGAIVGKGSADVFSAKSLRGSMGSAFRLPIWTGAGADEVLDWARCAGISLVGATPNAAKNYTDIDWTSSRLLILGSEAHGISADVANILDEVITIPMTAEVESLNLAVAAGVIMFEARRQVTSARDET